MSQSSQKPRSSITNHLLLLVCAVIIVGGIYLLLNDITFTIGSAVVLVIGHLVAATGIIWAVSRPLKRRRQRIKD
ncbi:MAG: hypothetical protein K8L91_33565 [Anaerolineae bacterium]|nr:hypothetical protein [Anaerolineae bacterium]